jgi:hypothetical protein
MSDKNTVKMLKAFEKKTKPPLFLSSFFKTDADSFHNQKKVEVDTKPVDEEVALPVSGVGSNYNHNNTENYSNTEVTPAVFKEDEQIPAADLMDRTMGDDPFKDVNFNLNGSRKALEIGNKLQNKIIRARELQAAQILTTGEIASSGGFSGIDYNVASTLFPTASVPWTTIATADPVGDLLSLAGVIRKGGTDAKRIIMDGDSFEAMMAVTTVAARFNSVDAKLGAINPIIGGGTGDGFLRGWISVGNYRLDIYTYGGQYKLSGTDTLYLPRKKVIMLGDNSELRTTFGGIPKFPSERALQGYLPRRVSNAGKGADMSFNAWASGNREVLNIGVGTRMLLIPVDKTAFGCLDTDLA